MCKPHKADETTNRRKRDIGPFISVQRNKREAQESDEEIRQRSYGSKLGYECGLARQFEDPETQVLYQERWLSCNWNKSWTPVDTLDNCKWIQCINPPKV